MPQFNRVLIIGASSGIGKALAEKLLKDGSSVAMAARRVEPMDELAKSYPRKALVYRHDVTDYAETPALFQKITGDLGGLDLIIYSAGTSFELDVHEFNFDKDRTTIEVNVLGAFSWLDEAAKRFEQTKSGTIVGISSIAGERGRTENPPYFASKAALTAFLESLRNRLWKYGVKVVTIKPGFVDTGMMRKEVGGFMIVSADRAADLILLAIRRKKNTAYIPARWRLVSAIIHILPSFIFKRLSI
jgi:short-subunit dehydrogenase